jgi:putative ABC transport system substrate-binding protein
VLEVLTLLVPSIRTVGYLANTFQSSTEPTLREFEAAAASRGFAVQFIDVQLPEEIEPAIERLANRHVDAVVVNAHEPFTTQRTTVADVALRYMLPTLGRDRTYADAGGMAAFGASQAETYHRPAYFVDRILRGARPSELPVEQPTAFDFVVNTRTARALSLTIPPEVAAQVTDWVE